MPPLTRPPTRGWRQLLENPEEAARAFPSLAGAMAQPAERRRVLKTMAASLALGGLGGCDPGTPDTHWVPAVIAPPGIVPGIANRYATASPCGGAALGIVVEHRMGRPIKVEGNPLHPASLGATDALAQALVLDFYDPDRSSGLLRGGQPATLGALMAALLPVRTAMVANRGAGLRILTGSVISPTLGRTLDAVLQRLPDARWHQWEAVGRDAPRLGARLAYGRPVEVLPRLANAELVLGLESDLISGAPGWVRHARDLARRRNPTRGGMSRLYAAESIPSLFGTASDHRMAADPPALHAALLALSAGLLRNESVADAPPWVAPVLDDLRAARGRALIHAGPHLPPEAHALVHAMNEALGGRGHTFDVVEPFEHRPEDGSASLADLTRAMAAGQVQSLLILDANPVHTVPGFADLLRQVPLSLHAAAAPDETAQRATWHVPLTHPFEGWGDARAHDGTATILQPQALPLHGGRTAINLLSLLVDARPASDLAAVRDTWRDRLADDDAWFAALADGVVPNTAGAVLDTPLRAEAARAAPAAPAQQALHVLFRPDPYLLDGRHANNAWLQELPRPLTKLTWDNPLLLPPALAQARGLHDGDVVALGVGGESVELPVATLPGLAANCAVATLGYGRRHPGEVGQAVGWDLLPLRAAIGDASLRAAGRRIALAGTDRGMGTADAAEIARQGTLARYRADPAFLKGDAPDNSLYRVRPDSAKDGLAAWGMSIDLNACIGCNACVVACQAENNVPVVGRDNVLRQREMHWLRIDRYRSGPADAPDTVFQPMLCMHCEEAPCETVCPVEASVHDQEGLNLQVYNRCVGTRFCSNNCPYKVRRFNFGPYATAEHRPPLSRNPDVTVRARGVMEKCTFCVQRIATARIEHDRDGVPEHAVTACQAACPTQAFTFGDLNDPASAVTAKKRSPLDYVLLPDQQTHPRVTYEARIRNPNPSFPA